MKDIKYTCLKGRCTTFCSYTPKNRVLMVGSIACQNCRFNKDTDTVNKIVKCSCNIFLKWMAKA